MQTGTPRALPPRRTQARTRSAHGSLEGAQPAAPAAPPPRGDVSAPPPPTVAGSGPRHRCPPGRVRGRPSPPLRPGSRPPRPESHFCPAPPPENIPREFFINSRGSSTNHAGLLHLTLNSGLGSHLLLGAPAPLSLGPSHLPSPNSLLYFPKPSFPVLPRSSSQGQRHRPPSYSARRPWH